MLYLNKLLNELKNKPTLFKSPEIIFILGISSTQIKDLKKYALENQLITQSKNEFHLTKKGEEYLLNNPFLRWSNKNFQQRSDINVEYLKQEKAPAILIKAMRLLAKHLINKEPLKEFSLEHALFEDIKKCAKIRIKIENDILMENVRIWNLFLINILK